MNFVLIRKTLRDHWKSSLAWGTGTIALAAIELYIYPTVVKSAGAMQQYIDAFPEALKTIFRMEDYVSGSGFLGTELFSMMFPLIFISIAAARGSDAIAREIESGTADLLFTMPHSRTKLILSKISALFIEIFLLGGAALIAIIIGAGLVDMVIGSKELTIATLASILLGTIFGGLALIAGALTGRKGAATGLAVMLGIASFLFYSLAPLVDTFDSILPFNPFQWALNGNPLSKGVTLISFGKLIASNIAIYATALFIFQKKDIKA